jgi:hypothetical protein
MWVYDTIVGEMLPADIVNVIGTTDLKPRFGMEGA